MARNDREQRAFTNLSIKQKQKPLKQAGLPSELQLDLQQEVEMLRTKNNQLLNEIHEQSQTIEELQEERQTLLDKIEYLAKDNDHLRFNHNALLDILSAGVWITDAEGNVIQKNAAADNLWGNLTSKDHGFGFSSYKAWWVDSGDILKPEEYPLVRVLSSGKPVLGEIFNIERFDGKQRTIVNSAAPIIDHEGKMNGAVVIVKDITKQHQLEHQLKSIVELEPSGLAVIAGRDLNYKIANPAYHALLPDQNIDLVGKSWQEVWQSGDSAHIKALIQRVLETGDTISASQSKQRSSNGKTNYYSFYLAPLSWEGEPAVLIVVWETTTLVASKQRAESAARKAALLAAEIEAIFNEISDAVIFYDSQGMPMRANKAAIQSYGFDPVGKTREEIQRLLSIRLKEGNVQELEKLPSSRALAGEVVHDERLILTKADGVEVHILVSAVPLKDEEDEVTGAVLSWRDITEMEMAIRVREQLLLDNQRQRDLLARLIAEAPAAIAFMTGPEHRYSLTNEKFEQITNDFGNVIGLRFVDVFPVAASVLVPIMDQVFETGETYSSVDMGIPFKKGDSVETRYFSFSLTPVEDRQREIEGIMLMMFETTEAVVIRQRLEAERDKLQKSEERFRQLADAMPQLVLSATPEGAIDYINERYIEFDGIQKGEEGDWSITHLFHPDDQEGTVEAWDEAMRNGENYQYEHRIRMANGTYRWHLSRAVPVRNPNGEIVKWYGTATNIDTQKQVERNLEEYARKLKRSNEELENFAFIASHDLQEPLRKIKSFGVRVVKKLGQDVDEETQDFLVRMVDASKRMQEMIQALLNLSRINTRGNPFDVVDLNKVVADVVSDLDGRLRESQGKVVVGKLPKVYADEVQIGQLFQNLIGNAIKYHKPGIPPVVNIVSESEECEPSTKRKCIKISIVDNGIGFEQEHAERIFQPFQRLVGRSEYEGTGIGLTICEKIVERHGGSIVAKSQPNQGSKFTVVLPELNQ
ncbi:MAG: PAS domain S-box protein [Chloroflexi bacterium]|nr:MAG: PAS domain S-box protein [Chloroflexota bacterium]